jgi:Short C-terminal domain
VIPASPVELEKLAQLKAQGILTEEESEAKKRQILGI